MGKKPRKKLRVAFKKNRQKRARPQFGRDLDDAASIEDLQSSERLSGKGELTRHRTIIATDGDGDDPSPLRELDESTCVTGRVIRSVGLNSIVQTPEGQQFECTVRRVLRTMSRDARNVVTAGDVVLVTPIDDTQGVIERVTPRHGVLSRTSQRREHVLVANIDQVVIIASADEPPLKPALIDRFVVSAEKGGVRPVICINKCDLVDVADLMALAGQYSRLGCDVAFVSATSGRGIDRLEQLLAGKQSVFTGQSGVGKSSLLNSVVPEFDLKTNYVSRDSGKGRHTTRSAVLLELPAGDGWVVDTPGIRQLELWDVLPEEVEGYFAEFRPFVIRCRFPDCTHTHEKGCGVKEAVEHRLISHLRYEGYVRIVTGESDC